MKTESLQAGMSRENSESPSRIDHEYSNTSNGDGRHEVDIPRFDELVKIKIESSDTPMQPLPKQKLTSTNLKRVDRTFGLPLQNCMKSNRMNGNSRKVNRLPPTPKRNCMCASDSEFDADARNEPLKKYHKKKKGLATNENVPPRPKLINSLTGGRNKPHRE
ncbi:hypothetical protein QAD02_019381 [Eretmocerus hayati]|uniref:Uncharacterized protein n=1 Tax=Eretmocerus hayati TaxID=131215 RepID=A0ACC2PJ39_9HYME|nr:hypothetical protein QAD02_019381 [Eretmocerus hayati]